MVYFKEIPSEGCKLVFFPSFVFYAVSVPCFLGKVYIVNTLVVFMRNWGCNMKVFDESMVYIVESYDCKKQNSVSVALYLVLMHSIVIVACMRDNMNARSKATIFAT